MWSWFENETPISAKGRLALAKAMLARGDRGNAERLVREAWRSDPMSEDTESAALETFGPLLSAGDQKARMDAFAYTTENEAAAMRAAKRLGAGYVALVKARLASVRKAANAKSLLEAVPQRTAQRHRLCLCEDPAASPRGEIPRSRPAHDERPARPGPPV